MTGDTSWGKSAICHVSLRVTPACSGDLSMSMREFHPISNHVCQQDFIVVDGLSDRKAESAKSSLCSPGGASSKKVSFGGGFLTSLRGSFVRTRTIPGSQLLHLASFDTWKLEMTLPTVCKRLTGPTLHPFEPRSNLRPTRWSYRTVTASSR